VDILKYKDYEGTAELDMSRNVCRGKILFIDDLVTYEADLPSALQAQFEAAVDDYIATCAELGREPQRPFRGLFNVRVSPELHRAAALRSATDSVSLNEVVIRALDCYLNVRAEVNHNLKVTLEMPTGSVKTVRAVASGKAEWETANVH
jgi:predicted HicB family RNase H-like nuclease